MLSLFLTHLKEEPYFHVMGLKPKWEKPPYNNSLGFPRKCSLCSICALNFIIKLMPGPMSFEF